MGLVFRSRNSGNRVFDSSRGYQLKHKWARYENQSVYRATTYKTISNQTLTIMDSVLYKYNTIETVKKLIIEDIKKRTTKLAQYKRPTNIIVSREELPKTATKKIKRKEVKELICAK